MVGNRIKTVMFTYGCDDICGPCVCLKEGVCGDTFCYEGIEHGKNSYNEILDKRLMDRMGLEFGGVYEFSAVVIGFMGNWIWS